MTQRGAAQPAGSIVFSTRLPAPGGATTTLELAVGDLTADDSDAIVNPMYGVGSGGGRVDLSVHRAAGPGLLPAYRAAADAGARGPVLTPGFGLAAAHVIHVVAPRSHDPDAPARLAACYGEAILLASTRGLASIAFPSIGTGALGFPVAEASRVAMDAVRAAVARCPAPIGVRFVLFGPATFDAYVAAARQRLG